jgi:hypothetical protein
MHEKSTPEGDFLAGKNTTANNLNFLHCSVLRHFSTISEGPGHGLAPEGPGGELQTLAFTLILPLQGQLEVAQGPQVSSRTKKT